MGAVPSKTVFEKWLRYEMDHNSLPVSIRLWDGRCINLTENPMLTLTIASPYALRYIIRPSLATLGDAYVRGLIDIEGSLGDMIDLGRKASRLLDDREDTNVNWQNWRLRIPRRHTRLSDSKSVRYHYDLSNDFYHLWLDKRMVYSCAYFMNGGETLDIAQEQKLDHICRKLMLKPGERLLDIGCGWGGLICWAAKNYGVKATGITLSQNQFTYAREAIQKAGLQDQCDVQLLDYRDLGTASVFDKIASVGMIEHVGKKNLSDYFRTANRLLRPGGLFLNHGIVSPDTCDGVGYGGGNFIDRYVFPDAELPKLGALIQTFGREGFEFLDAESLRGHYAQTLLHWAHRLEYWRDEAIALVGSQRYRIWLIYTAACSIAFEMGKISVYQFLLHKGTATLPAVPWTRKHIYEKSKSGDLQKLRVPSEVSVTALR